MPMRTPSCKVSASGRVVSKSLVQNAGASTCFIPRWDGALKSRPSNLCALWLLTALHTLLHHIGMVLAQHFERLSCEAGEARRIQFIGFQKEGSKTLALRGEMFKLEAIKIKRQHPQHGLCRSGSLCTLDL